MIFSWQTAGLEGQRWPHSCAGDLAGMAGRLGSTGTLDQSAPMWLLQPGDLEGSQAFFFLFLAQFTRNSGYISEVQR